MLKTRVITAVVLVSILLPALFLLPQTLWVVLVGAFVGIAGWEWGALLRWTAVQRIALGVATFGLCMVIAVADPFALGIPELRLGQFWNTLIYGLAVAFWAIAIPLWLRNKWPISGVSGVLVGGVVLVPTWLAMTQLRALSPTILLATMAVVWVADIAAYFAGRALGKHKLAPNISPGKTWEGAAGALVGVMIYGMAIRPLLQLENMHSGLWVLLLVVITVVSIVGDLFESLLKRKAGIKDSSNVLPGHGGVLDRIDSLTSTLPVVAFFLLSVRHWAA